MLFFYTATIVAHHDYGVAVGLALQELFAEGGLLEACTPVRTQRQTGHTLVGFDAGISRSEKVIDEARALIRQAHPTCERGPRARPQDVVIAELLEREPYFLRQAETAFLREGEAIKEVAARRLKADGARWLPEISVSLISNEIASVQAAFGYWQGLPHNRIAVG